MKEGTIFKNQEGRFAIDNYTYFTCGSVLEIKINGTWIKTRIEADNGEYYAVGLKGLNLIGLKARG